MRDLTAFYYPLFSHVVHGSVTSYTGSVSCSYSILLITMAFDPPRVNTFPLTVTSLPA